MKIRRALTRNPSGAPSEAPIGSAVPAGPAAGSPHGGAASEGGGPEPDPASLALAVRAVDMRTSIRPTVAEVDLAALRRNVGRIRSWLRPAGATTPPAIFGVVKADAYGHGAVTVGRTLAPLCDALAVSLVEEGLELRAAGITTPILILSAYYDHCHSEVLEAGLVPVVADPGDLERFATAPLRRRPRAAGELARAGTGAGAGFGVGAGTSAGPDIGAAGTRDVHLKIDTGMNRLGVAPSDLPRVLDRVAALSRLRLSGLATHFASADMADAATTAEQLARFAPCLDLVRRRGFAPDVIHAANSAAAVRFPEARFGAVRPGLALYGAMPSTVVARPELEPVLTLRTRVMALHDVPPGAPVSYGGQWRATRPSRIATLPIGYADGYPRHVRDATVLIRGHRAPVAGAVCMDMFMIDVTDVPGVTLGDPVTLVGAEPNAGAGADRGAEAALLRIDLDELAARAGTVNYEILCGLSKRVPRLYRDEAGGDEPDGADDEEPTSPGGTLGESAP